MFLRHDQIDNLGLQREKEWLKAQKTNKALRDGACLPKFIDLLGCFRRT